MSKPLVLCMQLPVPNNPAANIPLAAGYLQVYAQKQGLASSFEFAMLPRDVVDYAGDGLLVRAIVKRQPTVLAVSLYTWNSERSLQIVALVKAQLPDLLVVIGGPEVHADAQWILQHPAVDLAVVGEGEQTFVEILRALCGPSSSCRWCYPPLSPVEPLALNAVTVSHAIAGTCHRHGPELVWGAPRIALSSLADVPSPYLAGVLELRPGDMALIECSRWCPYGCTFCLYGRSMGSKLGGRLFTTEQILAEVAWAREHGAGAIHFVEANLNLLPNFHDLMHGLQQINHDPVTPIYAELRGEHLKEATVQALVAAGLHTAEVGLQSANSEVLLRVGRRTDLQKWAVGTRRLYAHGVHVLLDVILGLPSEDRADTLATIDWIQAQNLGEYDIFTLQLLPGTGVRSDAQTLGLRFQDRPPYYVLETDQLTFRQLRGLRWELRESAGLDPLAVEGMPQPHTWFMPAPAKPLQTVGTPIHTLVLECATPWSLDQWQAAGSQLAQAVASHLVVHVHHTDLAVLQALCWPIAQANPTIHWDIMLDTMQLEARALRELASEWPHTIGYLDRIAVFRHLIATPAWSQVTPRWWLVLPWQALRDPLNFEGVAEIVAVIDAAEWQQALPYVHAQGVEQICVRGPVSEALTQFCETHDLYIVPHEGALLSILEHH